MRGRGWPQRMHANCLPPSHKHVFGHILLDVVELRPPALRSVHRMPCLPAYRSLPPAMTDMPCLRIHVVVKFVNPASNRFRRRKDLHTPFSPLPRSTSAGQPGLSFLIRMADPSYTGHQTRRGEQHHRWGPCWHNPRSVSTRQCTMKFCSSSRGSCVWNSVLDNRVDGAPPQLEHFEVRRLSHDYLQDAAAAPLSEQSTTGSTRLKLKELTTSWQ